MAEFIKAYNEKGSTVFELSVTAATGGSAYVRGVSNLLVRHPGKITAVEDVTVRKIGRGFLGDYRVIVTISGDGDIRDIIKMDEAIDFVETKL